MLSIRKSCTQIRPARWDSIILSDGYVALRSVATGFDTVSLPLRSKRNAANKRTLMGNDGTGNFLLAELARYSSFIEELQQKHPLLFDGDVLNMVDPYQCG